MYLLYFNLFLLALLTFVNFLQWQYSVDKEVIPIVIQCVVEEEGNIQVDCFLVELWIPQALSAVRCVSSS
jgi:hypothetical protein